MRETSGKTVGQQLQSIRGIDELCDAFESELNDGEIPVLSQFLMKVEADERPRLFSELLGLVHERGLDSKLRPQFESCMERFPEPSNTILDILKQETFTGTETSYQSFRLVSKALFGIKASGIQKIVFRLFITVNN